mmetsp:Transcript_3291/g.6397  ORF Transcript_3291/g.6397 Transcript_3291/m.6397 type:complete len:110 (+) Transcript_3291:749-1078(+)
MSNYNLPTSNINIRNHPIDINKKFEYTILLKLFENSFGSCTNMNIIYKKNLESFFLYPTFSTLILFFGNHEIIKVKPRLKENFFYLNEIFFYRNQGAKLYHYITEWSRK